MNEREIQVLGMSRSGNHAVCNWIFAQADEPKLLLNCAEGKTDPFATCRPFSTGEPGWRGVPDPGTAPEPGARRALVMHSYEDSWFAHAFSRELETHHDAWLGASRRRVRLLILRDPYNLFASRLKMGAALSTHVSRTMWKQHAREALGDTRRVEDKVVVLYNRWATQKDYRRDLAARLGLTFTDAGASDVPQTMGGSSFDGTAFDGRAAEMATRDRWRAYAHDPIYRAIFDPEMVSLATRLFGPPPAGLDLPRTDVGTEAVASGAGW
ncbi:hypothetical protein SAMN04488020_103261 [Palleronia marisminoris]|uniref:Sulfotransferase family protein n=1 Tax=Palleronia marisminoris TaxID=315423 RepID=A0A1Y5SAJ3_9RHOB|nr:hypothetical protein [Palleronia marisminoris]SFG71091.1 hypothetical protein SAMN04488020_103261 [Palleronia marisminoris]SLN36306.1 hypothetical protein PAM7066_01542 [Palleronia marisminoris]